MDENKSNNKSHKANTIFMRFIAITFSVLLILTLIFIRMYGNEWYDNDKDNKDNIPNESNKSNKSNKQPKYPMEATLISDLYHWDYENRTPVNTLDNGNPHIDRGTKFVEPRLGSEFVQEYNRYAVDDKFHPLERNDMLNEDYLKKKYSVSESIKYPNYNSVWGNSSMINENDKPDFEKINSIAVKDY